MSLDEKEPEADPMPRGVELSLTVTEGPDAGRSLLIDRPQMVVGRGAKADFRLSDDSVSSRHFVVEISGGEARLRDLKTTNGTRVNGEPCDHAVLISQDEIEVGESRIVFRVQTKVHAGSPPTRAERTEPGGPADDRMRAVERALEGAPADATVRDGSADQQPKVGVVRPDTAIFLEIVAGAEQGQVFDLSQPGIYVIGRGTGDVPLSDRKCSSKHAQIQVLGQDQYYLSDLASTNGTFLNGIRTGRRRLKHMDVIRIGETHLRFSAMSGTVPLAK